MTEQPVETEQQFLGNASYIAPRIVQPAQAVIGQGDVGEVEIVPLAEIPLQHYAPGAHLRRPSWAPVDDVELASLVRKSINANKLLAIAKDQATKAEDALSLALQVEEEAAQTVRDAEQALIAFTRKDTGL